MNAMRYSVPFYRVIWLFVIGLVLGGCGGGGDSPATPAAPAVVVDPNLTVPLQTAMANLVNNGFSKPYTLTGWVDNSTTSNPNLPHTPLSGSGTLAIGTPTSFAVTAGPLTGVTVLQSVAVLTGTVASSVYYYFSPVDYTILAISDDTKTYYYTPYTLPAAVKAGNTGSIGSSTTGGALASTTTGVYSVASDRADSLLVSFIETKSKAAGGYEITTTTYRITTLGVVTPVSISTDYYLLSHYKNVVLNF